MRGSPRYDLVLENGGYHTGVSMDPGIAVWRGKRVKHLLHLRGPYRLPLVGVLLRNHWAKRHGAIL